jgi:alpha-mannosidase
MVKKAEDTNGYIVRLYEAQNVKEDVRITFGFDVAEVYECDILENNIRKLEKDAREVSVRMSNFEIKTLRVVPFKN